MNRGVYHTPSRAYLVLRVTRAVLKGPFQGHRSPVEVDLKSGPNIPPPSLITLFHPGPSAVTNGHMHSTRLLPSVSPTSTCPKTNFTRAHQNQVRKSPMKTPVIISDASGRRRVNPAPVLTGASKPFTLNASRTSHISGICQHRSPLLVSFLAGDSS